MVERNSQVAKDLSDELLKIENELTSRDFKFGILYARHGQKKEADMFGNGSFLFLTFFLNLFFENCSLFFLIF